MKQNKQKQLIAAPPAVRYNSASHRATQSLQVCFLTYKMELKGSTACVFL